jgi:RHS repeat-associated protein
LFDEIVPESWLGMDAIYGPTNESTTSTTAACSVVDRNAARAGVDLTKIKYQFRVKADIGQPFKFDYTRNVLNVETGVITNCIIPFTGIGTGTNSLYPADGPIELIADLADSTNGCGKATMQKWISLGCDAGGGCASCAATPGSVTAENHGGTISVNMGLGAGYSMGGGVKLEWGFAGDPGSENIANVGRLSIFGNINHDNVVRNASGIRQVLAATTLADVSTTSSGFIVRYYDSSQLGTPDVDRLYDVSGLTAFASTTFSKTGSLFHVTHVLNGSTTSYDFEWSSNRNDWSLASGSGTEARKEVSARSANNLAVTNAIWNAQNQVVYSEARLLTPLGQLGNVVTNLIVGAGSASPKITQWFYYTNPVTDGCNYGQLRMEIQPAGSWTRYEYDGQKRVTKEVSGFLNAAPDASESLCRVVTNDYALINTNMWRCQKTVEILLGQEVRRSYNIEFLSGESRSIQCAAAGADWDNTNNIVTRSWKQSDGKTSKVLNPDGTMTFYSYVTNSSSSTTTTVSGRPNEDGTDVIEGTKTLSATGWLGRQNTNSVLSVTNGAELAVETQYTYYSSDLDGSYTLYDGSYNIIRTAQQGCCGVESETDREGITTTFLYDSLKRQYGSIRNGIINANDLDAAGNVIRTWRQGTDNTIRTLGGMAYDSAGRLLYETNVLGGVTSHVESINGSGETVRTTTYPDGGQSIETLFRDGSTKSVTGSAAQAVYYEYGVDGDGTYTKTFRGSASSAEWEKSSTDFLGRGFKTLWPGNAVQMSYYNRKNQMTNSVDPDGVSTLYLYNGLGQVEYTVADANRNGAVDWNGTDRITRSVSDVVQLDDSCIWPTIIVRRSRVWRWNDAGNEVLLSQTWSMRDGSQSMSMAGGLTNQSLTMITRSTATRQGISTAPDGSTTESLFENGQLVSVIRKDALGNQLSAIGYSYDAHGRQSMITDARNGTTTYGYHPQADLVQTMTTPAPAAGKAPLVTTTYYDKSLRATNVVQPDNTSTFTEYYANGSLKKTWGSRTYPVAYTYDYADRMKTMTTWQNYAGSTGAAVTTWNYDASRGWLSGKMDASSKSVTYSNTPAGRLYSRKWARNITTTYGYNNLGDLQTVTYSDSTPGITYGYNRFGQQTSASQGATTVSKLFSDTGLLLRESYSGGPLGGISVTNAFDALLRRTNLTINSQQSTIHSTAYSYDDASRLKTVAAGAVSAEYSYLANSPLVEQIQFKHGDSVQMTTTRQYDSVNRLASITSVPSASTVVGFSYQLNDASQRTAITNADGSTWVYQYDSLGQVTSGKRYWSDGTLVAGQQFDYVFDDIGNRKTASRSGGAGGLNARTSSYSVNALNQYTSRTVPGWVSLSGEATNTATVTVNDQFTVRRGNAWWGEVLSTNVAGPAWLGVTNRAVLRVDGNPDITNAVTGGMLVPKASEIFAYDDDGNMTGDTLWTNTWNGENRLVNQQSVTGVPIAARLKESWTHLPDGRWIERIVSTNNGTTWYPVNTNRYVWDGNVLVAVLNNTNTPIQTFIRGLDLSGSIQGAGGVGGVLWISEISNAQIVDSHFAAYDGNGNVMALVKASDATESARYEYGPFGETIRATGPMARTNPIRFSTQYADDVTGNVKYLFRDYCTGTGRWASRDPIGEEEGCNLYNYVLNDSGNRLDAFGLLLIAFDGTGSKEWLKTNSSGIANSHVYNFFTKYNNKLKLYKHGPNTVGYGIEKSVEEAYNYIVEEIKKNPEEQIDIIGHSRGGLAAILLAKKLKDKFGCPVRFVGLYDAVNKTTYSEEKISDNVNYVAHAIRDRTAGSRDGIDDGYEKLKKWKAVPGHGGAHDLVDFGNTGRSGGKSYTEKSFFGTHGALGGDPWGGDRPLPLDQQKDDKASKDVQDWMFDQAVSRGLPLQ